jgi:hypothetical protein
VANGIPPAKPAPAKTYFIFLFEVLNQFCSVTLFFINEIQQSVGFSSKKS